jgi:hypothetical protein
VIALSGGPLSRIERVALVAALAMSVSLMLPMRSVVPDGAYAWLHVARHLAHGAGLTFNVGEHLYTTANPLWVTLLADGMAAGLDGLTLARALGAISTLLTSPLFLQLLRRTVRTPALRALGTVAWGSHAAMARWAMSGLETPLAVALVLGGFVALTEGADWGERPIRTGALWALAALTRPGAVLLLVLWGTALLIDAQNRPGLRRLVFGLAPVAAIYGSWLVFARLSFGTFWPAVLSTATTTNPTLGQWWSRLTMDYRSSVGIEGGIVLAGVAALVFGRLPAQRLDRSALRLLPLAWIVLLPALFAARGLDVSQRQLLLVVPILHWLAWWAIDRTWSGEKSEPHAWTRAAIVGAVVATIVVAQNLVAYRLELRSESRRTERAAGRALVEWGRWLRANARRTDVVATRAPGALAYFGEVRILDLRGLFSARPRDVMAPAPAASDPFAALESGAVRAAYLVDRTELARPALAEGTPRATLERLDERSGYSFYRVHWSDAPRPPSALP